MSQISFILYQDIYVILIQRGLMVKLTSITTLIESLREKKKISYDEFTQDVISVRSYRRYVNEGKVFSFEVLLKLIAKLNIHMRDFLIMCLNHNSTTYQDEVYFAHYLEVKDEKMIAEYEAKVRPPFQSYLGSPYLEALLLRRSFYQGKISKEHYFSFLKAWIDFNRLTYHESIDRKTLSVLLLILDDGTFDDKKQCISLILDILFEKRLFISFKRDVDLNQAMDHVMAQLLHDSHLQLAFDGALDQLLPMSFQQVQSSHLTEGYLKLLKHLCTYYKEDKKAVYRYLPFYIMASYSSIEHYHLKRDAFLPTIISKEDLISLIQGMNIQYAYFLKESFHAT